MNRRSVLAPLAIIGSFGIALVPTLAEAATPTSSAHAFIKADTSAGSAAALAQAAGFATYTSPASKSKLVRASATTPNPDLAVGITAKTISAFGVVLSVTVSGLTSGTATLDIGWGDGGSTSVTVDGDTTQPLTYQNTDSLLGAYKITAGLDDGSGDTATNSLAFATRGSDFTAVGPSRVLDTRYGIGASATPVTAGGTLKLDVGSDVYTDGSPISAVVVNVTATDETANGVLTVYGDEDSSGNALSRPTTSNVNYRKGANTPNLVVVPVGKNGVVDFYNNSSGSTDLIADVQGYFSQTNSSEYVPVTPTRIIDTRKGIGTGKVAQIPANGTIVVPVAGLKNGVVPGSALSVALNLTAVDGTKNGVITAYAGNGGSDVPTASNLNYSAGSTSANMAIVQLGFENPGLNEIAIHNSGSGPVDVVADVFGYFAVGAVDGSAYIPLSSPVRVLDTRRQGGPLDAGTAYSTPFPFTPSTAGIFNATVTEPTGNGFLSLYPYNPDEPSALPTTSNLNYRAGQTVPNLAFVSPGTVENTADGNAYEFGIYLGGKGTAQVIVDWFGFFQNRNQ